MYQILNSHWIQEADCFFVTCPRCFYQTIQLNQVLFKYIVCYNVNIFSYFFFVESSFKSFLCMEQKLIWYFQISFSQRNWAVACRYSSHYHTESASPLMVYKWRRFLFQVYFSSWVFLLSQIWNMLYFRVCICRNKKKFDQKTKIFKAKCYLSQMSIDPFCKSPLLYQFLLI